MIRSLLIVAALTLTATTMTNDASAQKRKGKVKVQVKFNGGGNHFHKHNHNHNWKKQVHWNHNNHWHGKKVVFHNHNLQYVSFGHFPYKVCWAYNQYWVWYGNQWIPYTYMVRHHAGCYNWHVLHFHKQKHKFKHNIKF